MKSARPPQRSYFPVRSTMRSLPTGFASAPSYCGVAGARFVFFGSKVTDCSLSIGLMPRIEQLDQPIAAVLSGIGYLRQV